MNRLPIIVKHSINARTECILEGIIYGIEHGAIKDIDGCNAFIDDTPGDDTAAIELGLDDRLTLVEWHAEDFGLEFNGSLGDIRRTIEDYAAYLICSLAEGEVRSAVFELEMFLDENDFELEEIASNNVYAWARHYAEREEDDAYVYEYRNVEGDIHVDVWEYELMPGRKVYLNRVLEADEVTGEERTFDAT